MSLKSIEGMLPRQQFKVEHHEEMRAYGCSVAEFILIKCKHCGQLWFAKDALGIGEFIEELDKHARNC